MRRTRKEQNMVSFQHDMGFFMLIYHWDLCKGCMGFMSENEIYWDLVLWYCWIDVKNLGFRCDLPLTKWDVDVIYHEHMGFRSDLYFSLKLVSGWNNSWFFLKQIPTYVVDIPLGWC
jgi:hypothetical protein